MSECKNHLGTRATRRANRGRQRRAQRFHGPAGTGKVRALWAAMREVSRSGCVTNRMKLVIPGGRKV